MCLNRNTAPKFVARTVRCGREMALANPMRVVKFKGREQEKESEGTPTPIYLDREMGNANQIGAR